MAIDEHRRASRAAVSSTQIAAATAQATPATSMHFVSHMSFQYCSLDVLSSVVAIPMVDVAELPSPPPAAVVNPF